ncbi:hypothetical protein [Mycobacterium lepromatosis]|uniref:hypothetical protein n=1 Tax=Mycobacterium lepromatosis TaxID=480418 RepID=UPI0005F82FB6|nr:hypothetical protein [Mycobacterium lepromatosis]
MIRVVDVQPVSVGVAEGGLAAMVLGKVVWSTDALTSGARAIMFHNSTALLELGDLVCTTLEYICVLRRRI